MGLTFFCNKQPTPTGQIRAKMAPKGPLDPPKWYRTTFEENQLSDPNPNHPTTPPVPRSEPRTKRADAGPNPPRQDLRRPKPTTPTTIPTHTTPTNDHQQPRPSTQHLPPNLEPPPTINHPTPKPNLQPPTSNLQPSATQHQHPTTDNPQPHLPHSAAKASHGTLSLQSPRLRLLTSRTLDLGVPGVVGGRKPTVVDPKASL